MEATASGGLFIDTNEGLNNTGGKIAALGKNAEVVVFAGSGIVNGSGVISASGSGAHVDFETAISGGTLRTTSGGVINSLGGTITGVTIASGSLVNVGNAETLQLYGTIANSGTIAVSATTSLTDLLVGTTALTGGGKVQLSSATSGGESGMAAVGAGTVLTNVNNTIFGAGGIGVGGDTSLTLVNSGTINANVNTTSGMLVIDLLNPISNAGLMEATNSGGLYLLSTTISNTSAGQVVASGAKAQVILFDSTIIGGTLKTSGASAAIITDKNSINDGISGATIASGSLVAAAGFNETLTLSGGTIGVGATVETLSGGHIIVTGAVTNSGALFANGGAGSLLDIANGTVVTGGGIIKIGNGAAQIEGSGSENVTFVASASGGLLIDDAFLTPTAYSGNITSFGGVTHTNHSQFIDLAQVTSDSTVSAFYTSVTANSGVLTVTSGLVPVTVAQINFIGHYATSNFQISSGFGGTVMIVDPDGAERRERDAREFRDVPAARHRSAEYRFRRADDARLYG